MSESKKWSGEQINLGAPDKCDSKGDEANNAANNIKNFGLFYVTMFARKPNVNRYGYWSRHNRKHQKEYSTAECANHQVINWRVTKCGIHDHEGTYRHTDIAQCVFVVCLHALMGITATRAKSTQFSIFSRRDYVSTCSHFFRVSV